MVGAEQHLGGVMRCDGLQTRPRAESTLTFMRRGSECPLSGVKRTSVAPPPMSAFEPKRTLAAFGGLRLKTPIAYFQLVNLTRYNALS
jgi:hypothetical protein